MLNSKDKCGSVVELTNSHYCTLDNTLDNAKQTFTRELRSEEKTLAVVPLGGTGNFPPHYS